MEEFNILDLGKLLTATEVKALRIAFILFIALIIYWVLCAFARKITDKIPQKRLITILSLLDNIISVVVFGITALIILRELNIDIAPILASAGIIGLAVGFGAQTIVKDLISGIFLLTEDQVRQGDIVKIGQFEGEVEKIGIRSITLKDLSGATHILSNSKVEEVTNFTRGQTAADINLTVSAKYKVDEIFTVINETLKKLVREEKDKIIAEPEILGIDNIDSNKLQIKIIVQTQAKKQFDVKRRFYYLVKKEFESRGIELI